MNEVYGLFPIPVMRVAAVLPAQLVTALAEYFSATADRDNSSSPNLSHTALLQPGDSPLLVQAAAAITPQLTQFGSLLFGEGLGWSLKEMWVNVLDTGGRQAMHNHANSFISGVVYLTCTHHEGVATGPYNADKWISPGPDPGDMMLFPSYLMHAVPRNPGERRITLAFNAIPAHIDSWGYRVSFGA